MKKLLTFGILRHLLTAGGAVLASKGHGDNELWTEIIGGLIAFLGVIWSAIAKYNDRAAAIESLDNGELHPRFQSARPTKGSRSGLLGALTIGILSFEFLVLNCPAQTFGTQTSNLKTHNTAIIGADAPTNSSFSAGLSSLITAVKNDTTNWYVIPFTIYDPSADGNKFGYGLCLARPVNDYVVLDLRIEGEPDGTIYGVSGSVALQYPVKTLGVDWTPFTYVGVGQPLSGKSLGGFVVPGKAAENNDPVAVYGYGLAVKLYGGDKFSAGIVADVETWGTASQTYRFGPVFNFRF